VEQTKTVSWKNIHSVDQFMLEAKGRRYVLLFLLKGNAPATEIIRTRIKSIQNVTRCRDSKSAKSIGTR